MRYWLALPCHRHFMKSTKRPNISAGLQSYWRNPSNAGSNFASIESASILARWLKSPQYVQGGSEVCWQTKEPGKCLFPFSRILEINTRNVRHLLRIILEQKRFLVFIPEQPVEPDDPEPEQPVEPGDPEPEQPENSEETGEPETPTGPLISSSEPYYFEYRAADPIFHWNHASVFSVEFLCCKSAIFL